MTDINSTQNNNLWETFKRRFNKTYPSTIEELNRKVIYLENLAAINLYNQEHPEEDDLGVNDFSDLTIEEAIQQKTGAIEPENLTVIKGFQKVTLGDVPLSFDLRGTGAVSAVKNQGRCGSCWAFAGAAAVEGHMFKAYGTLLCPSEQQMVDCIYSNGCNGGNSYVAFDYMQNGIACDLAYTYASGGTGAPGGCSYRTALSSLFTTAPSYGFLADNDEVGIMNVVYNLGPVVVYVNVIDKFFTYKSGVYTSTPITTINHAIVVVGWTPTYWICKNSWGPSWGQGGFIYMARNAGLIRYPHYPTNLQLGPTTCMASGLSTGSIVGIVVGVIAGVIGIAVASGVGYYIYYRSQKKNKVSVSSNSMTRRTTVARPTGPRPTIVRSRVNNSYR